MHSFDLFFPFFWFTMSLAVSNLVIIIFVYINY